MQSYSSLSELVSAITSGEIPADVVSPGHAAALLGVTRQAINDRIHRSKSLEAWGAEGTVLISMRSIEKALQKKEGG